MDSSAHLSKRPVSDPPVSGITVIENRPEGHRPVLWFIDDGFNPAEVEWCGEPDCRACDREVIESEEIATAVRAAA